MKTRLLALFGMTAMMGALGAAFNGSAGAAARTTVINGSIDRGIAKRFPQASPIQIATIRRRIVREAKGCPIGYRGVACSPKEYGQYLQRTGRQKWTKKGGRA